MQQIKVHDMKNVEEYFVSTCSHVNEAEETDAAGKRSIAWLSMKYDEGLRAKVARLNDDMAGFIFCLPIETCPTPLIGKDLMVVPCLWVLKPLQGKGIGGALLKAAEKEAKAQGKKGLATVGHYGGFWFMPAEFFEHAGWQVARREGNKAVLWKTFDDSAEVPQILQPDYQYAPVESKVVVDLFYHTFCHTSSVEAQRVRDVCEEFGDKIVLNEYCADDRDTLLKYQILRGIFINGQPVGWGHEAPKQGLREAIQKALKQLS